jgi:hypothetical protein
MNKETSKSVTSVVMDLIATFFKGFFHLRNVAIRPITALVMLLLVSLFIEKTPYIKSRGQKIFTKNTPNMKKSRKCKIAILNNTS